MFSLNIIFLDVLIRPRWSAVGLTVIELKTLAEWGSICKRLSDAQFNKSVKMCLKIYVEENSEIDDKIDHKIYIYNKIDNKINDKIDHW